MSYEDADATVEGARIQWKTWDARRRTHTSRFTENNFNHKLGLTVDTQIILLKFRSTKGNT